MKTSPAPKPTLAILGKRDIELGPFAIDEAPQEPSPWANWRLRTDEDGIAWLLFDKKTPAPTPCRKTCSPSSMRCWKKSSAIVRADW